MNNFTVHYARAVQRLGAELHVPVADIYDALMAPGDWMVSTEGRMGYLRRAWAWQGRS